MKHQWVGKDDCAWQLQREWLFVGSKITLPETNIQVAPENGWLEDEFPLGRVGGVCKAPIWRPFRVATVMFVHVRHRKKR